jgi:hypothetical protein
MCGTKRPAQSFYLWDTSTAVLHLIPNQRIGWDTRLGPANANPGEGMKKPKDIQQPQHDGYNNHRIHD